MSSSAAIHPDHHPPLYSCSAVIHPDHHPPLYSCSTVIHPGHQPPVYSCSAAIHPGHHPPVYVLFRCQTPRPSPTSICPVPLPYTQVITHQYMSCSAAIHPDHHPPLYSCSAAIHPDHHPPVYVLFRCHPPRPSWCRLPSCRRYRIYQTRPILGYDPQLSPWSCQHPRSSSLDSHRRHPPRLEMAETNVSTLSNKRVH